MQLREKQETTRQWHTAGNLALADDMWDEREGGPIEGIAQRLGSAEQELTVDIESDPLGASKGILMGIGISMTLWCLIGLSILVSSM